MECRLPVPERCPTHGNPTWKAKGRLEGKRGEKQPPPPTIKLRFKFNVTNTPPILIRDSIHFRVPGDDFHKRIFAQRMAELSGNNILQW